ncbi:hypothetical protein AYJ54_18965 [Bradyrhizobium centrolobii]|uniref:Uncharacterized protein n=2 Tax=Bradyrhizobium TaxID=374 RepID=A0A176ZF72_9BRAD|nr:MULTISPECIES: hypothetical protein [Bradyrhizobium]OAF06902.1 hypothetical protein AYJ54_18965 [Bradyrhizobium centrolobii]OAF19218.1 hypothetical protein AXW67_37810 [Bradyrhizobium neotropicale]
MRAREGIDQSIEVAAGDGHVAFSTTLVSAIAVALSCFRRLPLVGAATQLQASDERLTQDPIAAQDLPDM